MNNCYVVINSEYSGQPATRYLSGFAGSTSVLLFGIEGELTRDSFANASFAYLMLDSRYWEQAANGESRIAKSSYKTIQVSRDYPVKQAIGELIKKHKIEDVVIDGHITTYEQVEQLKKYDVTVISSPGIFEKLREVKTDHEVKLVRQAVQIAEQAFAKIKEKIVPGVSEMQVAAWLEYEAKLLGSEKMAFDTIVASGTNSVQPHATTSTKIIGDTDSVIIDFGCVCGGYCSDLTYTLLMPRASSDLRKLHSIVTLAKRKAKRLAKAGNRASDVDKAARDYIVSRGYGEYFGHAVGHGVGMSIHELPHVHGHSETMLQKGHVITIEPGIYVPGIGGVRIETTEIVGE